MLKLKGKIKKQIKENQVGYFYNLWVKGNSFIKIQIYLFIFRERLRGREIISRGEG